jgi:hypothetical protein
VFRVEIAEEDPRKSSLVKYTNGVWSRAKVSRKPARLALQSVDEAEVSSQCSLLDKAIERDEHLAAYQKRKGGAGS